MQQQLELQEETTVEIRETLTSVQQEVDVKTRKLKKCYTKYMVRQFQKHNFVTPMLISCVHKFTGFETRTS